MQTKESIILNSWEDFNLVWTGFISPPIPLSLTIVSFLWFSVVWSNLVDSRLFVCHSLALLYDLTIDSFLPPFWKHKHIIILIFIFWLLVFHDIVTCRINKSDRLGRQGVTLVFTEWDGQTAKSSLCNKTLTTKGIMYSFYSIPIEWTTKCLSKQKTTSFIIYQTPSLISKCHFFYKHQTL